VADPDGAGVGDDSARMAERVLRPVSVGSGEALNHADQRLALGIFAGAQVRKAVEYGLGGVGVAAHRRQPGMRADEKLKVAQSVGIDREVQFGVGGVPLAQHQQRKAQVDERDGKVVARASPAQVPGGGPRGLSGRSGIDSAQGVPQAEQGYPQAPGISGLLRKPHAFAVIGGRFGTSVREAEVESASSEQVAELAVADVEGLTKGQSLSRQSMR